MPSLPLRVRQHWNARHDAVFAAAAEYVEGDNDSFATANWEKVSKTDDADGYVTPVGIVSLGDCNLYTIFDVISSSDSELLRIYIYGCCA